ncbi:MAG: efflux RND transporter periplasmic adaptor subunit, partial [Acidobacteria bacterium]|nr:efflux RND transporter periplasmic adaptor subunit [Acidobacteriota bacterium]
LAGSRPQEIERAHAAVQQAEATLTVSRTNYRRAEELYGKGILAKQALDDARNAHDVAVAGVEMARRTHELARIGPRPEQIELARAQLAEAEAAVQWLEAQMENSFIRAPVSGTVLERLIEHGEMVTTGFVSGRGAKAALVSIADLGDLEVELDVSEADIARVRPGQECIVSPDSYPERKYGGVVREIAPEANRQKATIQVKVSVREPDSYLRPETNAKVQFLDQVPAGEVAGKECIFLPKSTFVAGPALFLVKQGRAVRQEVSIGREMQGQVEVTSGLHGGEEVILRPPEGLADGDRIRPKN